MKRAASECVATRKVQILVVEDESVIAADIKDCLENLGYAVPAVAVSGEAAIATATAMRPDLVLMDIRLKGEMDGVQAAAAIWHCLHIPVVYSTGHSDRSTLERAKATGPFGYVLKPIEEQELYVAIETALQRFRLDRDLQEREQWLSNILKAIGDGVIVTDASSRVRFLNGAAEALTGWQQTEAIGKEIAEVFHPIHEQTQVPLPNPVNEALQAGELVYLPDGALLHARNGRKVPIADSAAPFHSDSGSVAGVVLVFRDVTERQQAEERNLAIARALQLEAQMAELRQLNQLKDDFLNTVSHELRTPLTNIRMAIRMLEVALTQRDPSTLSIEATSSPIMRYLNILSDQCDRQVSLVNDLLDLQRLNADAYVLDLSTIYLQRLLPELVASFQARAHAHQQTLQIRVAPDLPPVVTDVSGLNRILAELLNNAIKYTSGGERISIAVQAVKPALPTAAPQIQIQVCNSGVEIAPQELSRIFEQFYRIPSADRWQQGGTGLGLTLVKKLTHHLGGSIEVKSEHGQTCFTIELPIHLTDSPTASG